LEPKQGRGTTKQPVFEIFCRKGMGRAEVFDGIGADSLNLLSHKKLQLGPSSVLIIEKKTNRKRRNSSKEATSLLR